jgi:hypothetical protein
VALDEPRFLDRRPGRSYTDDEQFKLRAEGEPVDPDTQARISAEAGRRFEDARAFELGHRDAKRRSTRLRNVQSEALRLGVDGRRELGAIDAQLDLLGRKVSQRRMA